MKKIVFALFVVLTSTLIFSGCSNPKIISDEELARIFRDIYLTNSYANEHSNISELDSLSIYEPVLNKHGYNARDLQFTIGNFSKRKSARLSDVVNEAITLLGRQTEFYAGRIAIRDTVALIAREKYAEIIFSDSLIRAQRVRDTAALTITLPIDKQGDYVIDYDYFIDSVDHNEGIRFNHYLKRGKMQIGNNMRRTNSFERTHVNISLTATPPNEEAIVIDLNGYGKNMTTPNLTIKNLVVKHYIDERTATDSMARSVLDYAVWDSVAPAPRRTEGYVLLD